MPPNSKLRKDPFNGRWRGTWTGDYKLLKGCSRSWGKYKEKMALVLVLRDMWTVWTAVTGEETDILDLHEPSAPAAVASS